MWRTREGSTGHLLQLCLGYFVFYTIFGVSVKYFSKSGDGFPGMHGVEYLVYSTLGGSIVAFLVVIVRRWYRLESQQHVRWGSLRFPAECLYIVPSGICTAVVIPTTTLMYTLPISVMVAMVIMRGSIIVVSRIVDSVQIRQGLLHKRVFLEENLAVVFALLAMGAQLLWVPSLVNPLADKLVRAGLGGAAGLHLEPRDGGYFEFLRSAAALAILCSYIVAYAVRIYIMNYYKNTRAPGQKLNNRAFFAIEQIAAFLTLVLGTAILLFPAQQLGWDPEQLRILRRSFFSPHPQGGWAVLTGMSFGIVAFFSVFIFMFKGRTATFAGLVNRLTSLVAGTAATLAFHYAFGGRVPEPADWLALLFILIAVGFLTQAERKRRLELLESR
jgi:hypothetical protein